MSRFGGGSERWDPERFNRERLERSRGPPIVERDRFFEERDRFPGGEERIRERSVDEFYAREGPPRAPARYKEEDRYFMEEKFSRPLAHRPRGGPGRYYDEEGASLEGSPNRGQIVPFTESRRKSITDRFAAPARRVPPRPTFIRRQSSLDTFDRKPMPRYGDRLKEPPEVIPVPIPPRRRSPPRFVERDYEEIRVAEPERYGDEDFRGYREREVSTVRRRRGDSEVREREVIEERKEIREEIVEQEFPKRGKTRMPMRLINKRAIIELGYPFEEEGETLIILKALGKEHIDEVISISRRYNAAAVETENVQESRTTYLIEAPAPPPEEKIVERRTEIIREVPAEVPRSVQEWDVLSMHKSERRSPSPSAKSRKSRAHSPAKSHRSRARSLSSASTQRVEIIRGGDREESGTVHGGAFALMAPAHTHRRDERSIKAEIRALEAEKKALKLEREVEKERSKADRYRETEFEVVRDVVKIEKDRKGRLSLVRTAD